MEKSIEKIWNESFINEQSLIAPKINDLYNRKSKSIINRIKRTYEIDNKGLIPMGIVVLVGMAIFSEFIIGLYGAFLIFSLYFFNRNLLSRFKSIDIKSDNLTYLKNYRSIISSIMISTRKLFMFGLPIAVMSIFALAYTIKEKSFLARFIPDDASFLQVLGVGVIMAIVISIICTVVYIISTKILYGTLISKLDDIIAEMDALKKV